MSIEKVFFHICKEATHLTWMNVYATAMNFLDNNKKVH